MPFVTTGSNLRFVRDLVFEVFSSHELANENQVDFSRLIEISMRLQRHVHREIELAESARNYLLQVRKTKEYQRLKRVLAASLWRDGGTHGGQRL
jgi:hypothetical protein